jgi:hypothetical protein
LCPLISVVRRPNMKVGFGPRRPCTFVRKVDPLSCAGGSTTSRSRSNLFGVPALKMTGSPRVLSCRRELFLPAPGSKATLDWLFPSFVEPILESLRRGRSIPGLCFF